MAVREHFLSKNWGLSLLVELLHSSSASAAGQPIFYRILTRQILKDNFDEDLIRKNFVSKKAKPGVMYRILAGGFLRRGRTLAVACRRPRKEHSIKSDLEQKHNESILEEGYMCGVKVQLNLLHLSP